MSPTRRRLLHAGAASLALGCSGCLSADDENPGEPTPTDTDEPTPTEIELLSPTDCPDEPRVPEANFHPDAEDAPEIPDPVETLADDETVEKYVEAYERAYIWREVTTWPSLSESVLSVSINPSPDVTDRLTEDAVILELDGFPSGEAEFEEGEDPGHFDGKYYVASHLVTVDGVWRASEIAEEEGGDWGEEPPDPREDGKLLECF